MRSPEKISSHFSHPKYRPDIDGLRAIAVLSVLGFHAFGVMGGFSGVDIFFVISGYLISTIIFENLDKNTFSFIEFYQRRIRRIFPSLLIVLITCLAVGWLTFFADEFQELAKHVIAGAGFVSNLVLWGESGYFDVAAETKPLLHLWSLGIEEQFYFFWPLMAWLLWKYQKHFYSLIGVLAAISFVLNVWFINSDSVAVFYLPLTRFWELLAGAFLAYAMLYDQQILKHAKKYSNTFGIVGFLLIGLGIAFLNKRLAFPGWWALVPVAGAVLLILAGSQSFVGKKILSNRILVWFGLISFPLYLWHWPLLTFVRVLSTHSRFLINLAIALSILLAWLCYRYVEKPIRHGKHQGAKSIILIMGMAIVVLIASVIYWSEGIPSRIDDGQDGKLANQYREQLAWPESFNHDPLCVAKYGSEQYCLVSDIKKSPTAALIGDSHANHFYPGLNAYIQKQGGNLILLGAGGCPPFFYIDRANKPPAPNLHCYQKNAGPYQFVLNNPDIQTVYLSFRHNLTLENDFLFVDKLGEIQSASNHQKTVDALTRTIKLLESKGKQVILIYDMPQLDADIKRCTFKRPYFSSGTECTPAQIKVIKDFDEYDAVIAAVKKNTHLKVFDTRPYVEGSFPVDRDGNLNYRDSTHLSLHGSMFFADKFSADGQK